MKIGVRAHDFGRKNEKILAKEIKESGFDCVQLAITKCIEGINFFSDITIEKAYNIKNEFEKNGVTICVLGCYIEPSILDIEKRLENIEIFKKSLEIAKVMEVKVVGTETTHFFKLENERKKSYEILKDSIFKMIEKAEKENIFVGVEPVADHTLNNSKLTKNLLNDIDSKLLKVIFDPANLLIPSNYQEQDNIFNEFFDLLGDNIIAFHAKDFIIENNEKVWRNLGDGIINYQLIFDWILKNKPNLEILREGIKLDSYKKDINFLKKFVTGKGSYLNE